MKRLKPDFKSSSNRSESYYDVSEDWVLVESSIAKQYGIRIRSEKDMSWSEFSSLLSGLMADTPLGQIVSIRSEKDTKTIKAFNPEQRRIYNEWKSRSASKQLEDSEKLDADMIMIETMFASMFGSNNK